jgi:hypothetical protein
MAAASGFQPAAAAASRLQFFFRVSDAAGPP